MSCPTSGIHLLATQPKEFKGLVNNKIMEYADKGITVIATYKNPNPRNSGHVAVVKPGDLGSSSKALGEHRLPKLLNIGPSSSTGEVNLGAAFNLHEKHVVFYVNPNDIKAVEKKE